MGVWAPRHRTRQAGCRGPRRSRRWRHAHAKASWRYHTVCSVRVRRAGGGAGPAAHEPERAGRARPEREREAGGQRRPGGPGRVVGDRPYDQARQRDHPLQSLGRHDLAEERQRRADRPALFGGLHAQRRQGPEPAAGGLPLQRRSRLGDDVAAHGRVRAQTRVDRSTASSRRRRRTSWSTTPRRSSTRPTSCSSTPWALATAASSAKAAEGLLRRRRGRAGVRAVHRRPTSAATTGGTRRSSSSARATARSGRPCSAICSRTSTTST